MIRYGIASCSVGKLAAAWSDEGLKAIELGDTDRAVVEALRSHFPQQLLEPASPPELDNMNAIARFIDNPSGKLAQALVLEGSEFQRLVWQALREIPMGTTLTYTQLANRIGKPRAVRAVASACAANKLAVVIPCHRIVRSDGGLGGYRWGIERKRALLNREGTLAASAS